MRREHQAWQAAASPYSLRQPLTLDSHGLRQRLNQAYAKVISAGRTATSAAAALASAAVCAASMEDRVQTLDGVMANTWPKDPWSDAGYDKNASRRRRRAPDKQRRCQSVASKTATPKDVGVVGAPKGQAAALEFGISDETKARKVKPKLEKQLSDRTERLEVTRPGTESRLSPWSELSVSQETSLRQALAAESPEIIGPGAHLPPMKKWLQEKIVQLDRHSEVRYKSSETPTKVVRSDAEIYTEHFLQQQFPVSVLRGDDDWQHFREEEQLRKQKEKHEKEKMARRSQRQSMAQERLRMAGRDEQLRIESASKSTTGDFTGELTAQVSPRTSLLAFREMDHETVTKTQKLLKLFKPKNALERRLEILEKLANANKVNHDRGSVSTGWGVVKMIFTEEDATRSANMVSLLDALPAADKELLRASFIRYTNDVSTPLKGEKAIRSALKDSGLFPKTTTEKSAVAATLQDIVQDKMGQSFEEFIALTRKIREVLMEVQRPQLEEQFMKFSSDAGILDVKHLPEIFKEISIGLKIQEVCDMKEVEKHFSFICNADAGGFGDTLQNFEEFCRLFQSMLEKIFSARRQKELDIAAEMGVNDGLLQEFRLEIPALYEKFCYYDKDKSGHLERTELMSLLSDRGVLPRTKQQIREVEQIISESKRQSKMRGSEVVTIRQSLSPKSDGTESSRQSQLSFKKSELQRIPESDNVGIQFNFSEFLLLIKRVRKLNSDIQENEMDIIFNRYDTDRSGELDMHEVSILLADVGLQPRNREDQDGIMFILQEVDEDGSNTFSLDEFKVLVSRIKERREKVSRERQMQYAELLGHSADQYKELIRIFSELDETSTGALGPTDIKRLLSRCRKKFTEKEFQRIFAETDKDGSGLLEFPEFLQLMATLDRGGAVPTFDSLDMKK